MRLSTPSSTHRILTAALTAALTVLASRSAEARRYTLTELLDLARAGNPGLKASAQQTAAVEAQLEEARRSWWPTGELISFVAPGPRAHCAQPLPGEVPPGADPEQWRLTHCTTGETISSTWYKIEGVFTRSELKLVQPIYTFGKITAGREAGEAGVAASREREAGARADLELNVRKAYWGLKLARELLSTLEEGSGYIDDAQKKIEGDLAEGKGTATVTDKLRLRTVRAEVDARMLEARRGAELARNGLIALIGPDAPADLDVDEEALEAPEVDGRSVEYYEEQARLSRPEVKALGYLVQSKQALARLNMRKMLPDLVIMGNIVFAYNNAADQPKNSFLYNPYNGFTGGIAAALRVNLDFGTKYAQAQRAEAEAAEVEQRRREALGGIALEVKKSYGEMTEAAARVQTLEKGSKAAKSWITAVAQNFAIGLAETRDLSDALLAHFQMRARYLQAIYDLEIGRAVLARATGGQP